MKVKELKRVIEHLPDEYEVRFQLHESYALGFAKSIIYGDIIGLSPLDVLLMQANEYSQNLRENCFRISLEPCDWDWHENNWTEFDNEFEIKETTNK